MEERKQRLVLNLPPGYHFAPTDMELIVHYLRRKMDGHPPHLPIFKDVPITDYRPEQITEVFMDCGEERWYFFTKRTRKYATGNRPDRTTPGRGYWKATGPQRLIRTGPSKAYPLVGRRRTLVFYTGPDEAAKTAWTMYEYENLTSEEEANDKNADKLGEWVLCTIQRQKNQRSADDTIKGKAGGRKRKGKAQKGADDQVLQIQGTQEVAEKVDETDMFELEQASRPNKRPQLMQQQHDEPAPPPPCPETMIPAQDCDYGPGTAPPSQEPPPQLSDSEMVDRPGVSCYGFDESMLLSLLEYETMAPLLLGLGYNDYSTTPYQPATSYLDAPAAPLGAFSYGYGSAAHQPAGHLNNGAYAGGHPGGLLGTSNSTYSYPQQHSYAAGSSSSTYLQQHPHAAGTNKLAPSSSTYTYQQQHAHAAGTTKAAGTNKLASSNGTYQQQHSYAAGTNKADGTSNLSISNSTYTYQLQQSCAAGANKLALVRGAMSSGIGKGSDVQLQVEL
ncbi:hypothetical protein CFC21_107388 [Triticum aestivum]|uniref:NAC domain-containing protein n=2 Tax=Triticum aestivum TaxID=4565 RepID=A0A9R1MG71_WHEAT|nr:NAC domain-containing protein 2-like [Triticum aestivum]KAF7106670.1 hypothetical protein CFC21_107388 [Triticum aestivum]